MTGDIKSKLASSEAAESLEMEQFVANCFRARSWPAQQGVYYSDLETRKEREIDVISRHILNRPRRHRGSGSPTIHLSTICECKSLSEWSILCRKGDMDWHENRLREHWSGYEEHIMQLIGKVSTAAPFKNCNKTKLFEYFLGRAYPDERELAYELCILQPPVDLIATAFRPTKGNSKEREGNNPFWSAIQSLLSSTRAAEHRAVETMRSYTFDMNPLSDTASELTKYLAFFFDEQLTRRAFFHPVICCKSRLFDMDDDFSEIGSARIFIRNIDFSYRYVDVVNFSKFDAYIETALASFEKQSYKSIRRTWDRLAALHWAPGQSSGELSHALGLGTRRKLSKRQ